VRQFLASVRIPYTFFTMWSFRVRPSQGQAQLSSLNISTFPSLAPIQPVFQPSALLFFLIISFNISFSAFQLLSSSLQCDRCQIYSLSSALSRKRGKQAFEWDRQDRTISYGYLAFYYDLVLDLSPTYPSTKSTDIGPEASSSSSSRIFIWYGSIVQDRRKAKPETGATNGWTFVDAATM
jgi:hypothetical protein